MEKFTINDVAKYAGVSKKTVSRVLNNEPNVSQATKQKVQAVFEQLGYRPSSQARGLATNQSFLIGMVYDNPNNSYVSDIQSGALTVCNATGYHLIIRPSDHQSEHLLSDISILLKDSRLDGLVLTPPFSDMPDVIEMLEKKQVPYVRIAPTLTQSKSPCVISNDVEAAYEMTRYLVSLGHLHIGFIEGHPDHNVSQQRLLGYKKALQDNGIEFDPGYVQQGYFTFASGEDCARRLLAMAHPPSAIFASNDYMAAGVLKVASQRGIAVPHELSVSGFDDAPISGYLWPTVTTVKQPIEEMATQALQLLIEVIQKRTLEISQIKLDGKLIVRESTAPIR